MARQGFPGTGTWGDPEGWAGQGLLQGEGVLSVKLEFISGQEATKGF